MKEEMRKGLIHTREEKRMSQGILEASMVSITDLIRQRETLADTRMTEMSAIMKEWDRQADARSNHLHKSSSAKWRADQATQTKTFLHL